LYKNNLINRVIQTGEVKNILISVKTITHLAIKIQQWQSSRSAFSLATNNHHPVYTVALLGNNHETSNYTTAITRQRTINSNRGTVFSVQSVPRCYKQNS
jgi:uncharacterized protein HemY